MLAAAASLAYNFFFLPPVGTLTIADPENWELRRVPVDGDRRRASCRAVPAPRHLDAVARQRDLERLYTLSRGCCSPRRRGARRRASPATLPMRSSWRARALRSAHGRRSCARAGADLPDIEHRLREVGAAGDHPARADGIVVTAVRLGGAPIGSLALCRAARLSDTVLQSVANLAAIGLERAREREAARARRSGPPERRAARRAPRRAGARVQDAADVDAGGRRRPASTWSTPDDATASWWPSSTRSRTACRAWSPTPIQMLRDRGGRLRGPPRAARARTMLVERDDRASSVTRLDGPDRRRTRCRRTLMVDADADLLGAGAAPARSTTRSSTRRPDSTIEIERHGNGVGRDCRPQRRGSHSRARAERIFERFYPRRAGRAGARERAWVWRSSGRSRRRTAAT